MQHDLHLIAGGTQTIDVAGKFFKYKSGVGAIRVRDNRGGFIDLLPGQGVWNTDFNSLLVQDLSGAANTGVLLAGGFDFHDDRITGTVDIVDGGKARTLAAVAFGVAQYQAAVAAELAHVQFWNPAGSNKNIVVNSATMSSTLAGQSTVLSIYGTQLAVAGSAVPANKKTSGAASVVTSWTKSQAASISGQAIWSLLVGGVYKPTEPIVLTPGSGLLFSGQQPNASVSAAIEYFEDAIP